MFDKLQEIFEELGYKNLYFRQGSFNEEDPIPPSYFAFWNNNSAHDSHYNNGNHRVIWTWSIYFYTTDPQKIYTTMEEFLVKAKEKGFTLHDSGYDIPSDLPNYIGRMTQIDYIELLP